MELFDPLSDGDCEELERMLLRVARADCCSFSHLDGLFCAIAVGPNLVPPSVWLETIFGDEGPPFASLAETQCNLALVMRHYNSVVRATTDGTYVPALPKMTPSGSENRAQRWAIGFVLGMSLDDGWETLADGDDAMLLSPMLILADATPIVSNVSSGRRATESFISMIPQMVSMIRRYWRPDADDVRAGRMRSVAITRKRSTRGAMVGDVPTIHRLKIQLLDVKPAIWRRLEIASETKLPAVSKALLMTMGWTDTHLHAFHVGRQTFATPDPDFPSDDLDERRYTLAHVLPQEKDALRFDYDFGDGWEHRVTVEAIVPADPAVRYPRCLAGRRACPPEDCGGPYGYAELLETLADATHPEYPRLREWAGPFDPNAFDLADTNLGLDSIFRSRQIRKGAVKSSNKR